jgi:hypothetical protein
MFTIGELLLRGEELISHTMVYTCTTHFVEVRELAVLKVYETYKNTRNLRAHNLEL